MWTKEEIKKVVEEHPLLVFGKGTREQPQCGFTARAVQIMDAIGKPYHVVNIFDDESIRPALVEYSDWKTTPQIFIDGEFVGGSDILLEMYESGELKEKIATLG